jgi:hypothetical protein
MKKSKAFNILFLIGFIILTLNLSQAHYFAYGAENQVSVSQYHYATMPKLIIPDYKTLNRELSSLDNINRIVGDHQGINSTKPELVAESDHTMAKLSFMPVKQLMKAPVPIEFKQTYLLPANKLSFYYQKNPDESVQQQELYAVVLDNNHPTLKKKRYKASRASRKRALKESFKGGDNKNSIRNNNHHTANLNI